MLQFSAERMPYWASSVFGYSESIAGRGTEARVNEIETRPRAHHSYPLLFNYATNYRRAVGVFPCALAPGD